MTATEYSLDGFDASYALVRSRDRIMIVEHLRKHPDSYLADIIEGTAIPKGSLSQQLTALEGIGVIITDIPDTKRHGRAVRYNVSMDRTRELVSHLTTALVGSAI